MSESQDFVIVRLEDYYFAFDVSEVAEVLPYSEPVRVPRAAKFLAGVIDVRGHVLPVVDLRLRAGVAAKEQPAHILAVRLDDRFIGAIVDEVREIHTSAPDGLGEIATLGDRIDSQFVSRALRWGKRLVPVLDAKRLLTTTESLKLKRFDKPHRRRGEA